MSLSTFISRRLRLGTAGSGTPTAVVIAVTGVALALMVMEFTLAIVVGFKDGIRTKLMGFDAQISVLAPIGSDGAERLIHTNDTLNEVIKSSLPDDAEIHASLRQPGMLKTDNNFEGVVFIAQNSDAPCTFERSMIVAGEWPEYAADSTRNDIVISEPLAARLGLSVGDKVYSTFIIDDAVKVRRNRIAGLFRSDFGEYDLTVAYTSMPGLQSVLGVDSTACNRLDIRGIAVDNIEYQSALTQSVLVNATATGKLQEYYPVTDVTRTGAMYFNWLALLDTNVVVIFILMLAVAAFTLVSSLFILILERLPMIGVLRAMGADKPMIRNIFVDMGMRLVGIGMIIGNVLGLGLLAVQSATHIIKLDPEMYYLAWVPVEIVPWQMVALNIGVAVAAWAILIVPARVAADTEPSKTIYSQ